MRIELNMLDFWNLPHSLQEKVTGRYLEHPKDNKEVEFVIQRHEIGDSQHFDWRNSTNGYLVGWSIVGFSKDKPAEMEVWLENVGKGFRAETKCFSEVCNEWKFDIHEVDGEYYFTRAASPHLLSIEELARQPKVWLFKEKPIGQEFEFKPGEAGAGIEKPGFMTVLTRGKVKFGTQKCLVGNTKIIVQDKQGNIKRVMISEVVQRKENVKVLSPSGFMSIKHYIKKPRENKILKIILENGSVMLCDENHPTFKLEENEEIKVLAKELKIGDKLPVYSGYVGSNRGTYELGKFIGLYLAEGTHHTLNSNLNFSLDSKETELIQFLIDFGNKLGAKSRIQSHKQDFGIDVCFSEAEMLMGLVRQFVKKNKALRNCVFSLSKECRRGIIDGVTLGDGTKYSSYSTIEMGRKHKKLMRDLFHLCWSIGNVASIRKYKKSYKVSHSLSNYKKGYWHQYIINDKKYIRIKNIQDSINNTDKIKYLYDFELESDHKIILAEGIITSNTWFHEYFLKDNKYFKDWTRIVVRAVRAAKLDPETKKPIEGQFERFWRFMVAKDPTPYAISNRAIEEKWKAPRGLIVFPEEWAKKEFPKQYNKWTEYMKGKEEELSKTINYSLSLHKWRGPFHKRGMWRLEWYLFLDDVGKGQVRTFNIKGDPMREHMIEAWYEGRDSRKYLEWEGKTKPRSRFNPNKELYGEMKVLEKGQAGYESKIEEGEERIELQFKGEILKGTWRLEQEEKKAESYVFSQVKSLTEHLDSLAETEFVYHKHYFNDKIHYDLRIMRDGYLDEFNIHGDLLQMRIEEPAFSIRRKCLDVEKWFIKEGKGIKKEVGRLETNIDVLDSGTLKIIEDNPQFISMHIQGKKLRGYVVALKNKGWIVKKAKLPKALAGEGDPATGNYYKPFIIEQKRGWDYFIVNIYDIRSFTRCEPESELKNYGILPGKIPAGVFVGICLYNRPGKIHGARVSYIRFPVENWTPEKAISWIKDNKFHIWEAEQVRKEKEELAATLYPWMEVKKMDLPDRSCHGTLYTETGARDIILRAWTDNLALEILELYAKGITMFRFRVYGGYVTQVVDYKGRIEEIPELA